MSESGRDETPSTEAVEGGAGRFSTLLATVWLLFLVSPLIGYWDELGQGLVWLGYLSTFAFAATYVVLFETLRRRRARLQMELPLRWGGSLLGLLVLSCLGIVAGFGQDGVGAIIYVTVSAAMTLPTVYAALVVLATAGGALVASLSVPGWEPDAQFPLLAAAGGFVMWAVRQIMIRNVELVRTREENELLLVEQERNRFARDLHDILGHSLTVIAVKAELAHRLLGVDESRAAAEVADLERLSRDALADVRRAVQGYREITLPGELARARGVLAAAGIEAALPSSADDVAGELRQLFAWAIREAVTNIVRHSRATTAEIELTCTSVRISNDGVDPQEGRPTGSSLHGSGLAGLRERVQARGGRMSAQQAGGRFVVEVTA